jgi:ribonuclease HI
MISIFTDGACRFNRNDKTTKGAFSYVMINDSGVKMFDFIKTEDNTTNNRMEMKAVISALHKMQHIEEEVVINSDSQYIVNCIINKWYVKWIRNNWMRTAKSPVLNRDLWEEMLSLLKPNIKFKWVKGHQNNKWNEYCDELCNKALGGSTYVNVIQGDY